MSDCIFCKIVSGDIPSHRIYEDDQLLAFLDIAPVNPGHTLVIAKEHYPDLLALPEELSAKLLAAAKKIAPAIVSGVGASAFNLTLNNGAVAGQAVGHVHFHIIPRFDGDGHQLWHGGQYSPGQAEEILQKIKNQL